MSGTILISVVTTLIAGALLFSGLAVGSASTWLTLIPVLLLGLLAALPIGAVLGSLFPSARSAGLLTLAMGGLAAISWRCGWRRTSRCRSRWSSRPSRSRGSGARGCQRLKVRVLRSAS